MLQMVHESQCQPYEPVSHDYTWVRSFVALGSLPLLTLEVVGLATANPGVSAAGLFLYAFIGFGAAALMALWSRGWNLLVTWVTAVGFVTCRVQHLVRAHERLGSDNLSGGA